MLHGLAWFLPPYCNTVQPAEQQEEDVWANSADGCRKVIAKAMAKVETKSRLNFKQWIIAFHRYAMAAQALGQWTYAASMSHFDNCMRVASDGQLENRRDYLAIIYDSLLRESWANRAKLMDGNLNVDAECLCINKAMVEEAKAEYDKTNKGGTKASNDRGWRDYSSASDKQKPWKRGREQHSSGQDAKRGRWQK